MIPKGIHHGLGMADYHAWKLGRSKLIDGPISCSTLKAFAPNPYEWLHTPEREPTAAMAKGSLYDLALSATTAEFDAACVVSPFDNYRTKEAQSWKAGQVGKLIVSQDDIEDATLAAEAVRNHPVAGAILDGCEFQVGVIGEFGGIPAKALLDILPARENREWSETIVDYKTIGTGLDDESIRKAIGGFRYHWQAAFYRTLFNKVSTDRNIDNFAFIFQSTVSHEVRVVMLGDEAMSLGNRAVKAALEEFVRCAHNGIGSRYTRGADTLDLMPYHAMNEEERLEGAA